MIANDRRRKEFFDNMETKLCDHDRDRDHDRRR